MIKESRPEFIPLNKWIDNNNRLLAEAVEALDIEGVYRALYALDADANHLVSKKFEKSYSQYEEPILIKAIVGNPEKKPRLSESNRVEIVKLLLQSGAKPKSRSYGGVPALILAFDKYPIAKLLLEYGADPNDILDDNETTILAFLRQNYRYLNKLRIDIREISFVLKLCKRYCEDEEK